MTRIRRINVSQVEGDGADNTSIDEIRPFGETAFYIDNNGKLTLMMFDGVRNHRDSKVLSPGVLYGANADAGDGSGSDTIKLIPDASLGTEQYLVIDPTNGEPGHIHIRAGGTQDSSSADLYLGGEQTFVRVSDTTDDVVIRTTALGNIPIENVNVQTVDELVPPGNVWRLFINDSIYPTLGNTVQIGETVTTAWGTPITATITDIQQDAGNWQIHVDQNIVTGFNAGPQTVTFNRGGKSWTFDSTGALTFPDGYLTIQDSQGGVIVKAADKKSISLISSGDGPIGSAIGWYDNFLVPTKLAAVVANNPLYVGEGDVGIVTGDTPSEGSTTNVWNFGADGDLTLPGNIITPQQASISTSGGLGIDFDGVNTPNTIDIGELGTWNYVRLQFHTDTVTGNEGDVEFQSPPMGVGPASSIVLSPQGGQNGSYVFGGDGNLTLPGGGLIDGSDFDIEIVAGNDGASTFGSVTINTQAPASTYTVTQEGGFVGGPGANNITGNVSNSPAVSSIVAGMVVTGPNLVGVTAVTDVSIGPGGDFTITTNADEINPFDYNAVYSFTTASGTINRNWEFNSLGEFYLPQGGAIQETTVTNEAFGTTTTSLTLVPGGAANGTQRLEIYGTIGGEGNHIHITSGDQNQTDLFLGNDTQYVAVGAMGEVEIRARRGLDSPSPGTGAYAGSPVWIYAGDAGSNGGDPADGSLGGDIFIQAGSSTSNTLGGGISIESGNGGTGYGAIELTTDGGTKFWRFNKDYQLEFPDDSIQTTAWAGGRVRTAPTTSKGSALDLAGDIAFTNSHLYYCKADYTDGIADIWVRSAWDETSWGA